MRVCSFVRHTLQDVSNQIRQAKQKISDVIGNGPHISRKAARDIIPATLLIYLPSEAQAVAGTHEGAMMQPRNSRFRSITSCYRGRRRKAVRIYQMRNLPI
jgi:hypothetical protein